MSKVTLARGALTGSSTAPGADDLLLELVSVGDVTNVIIYWPQAPTVARVPDFRRLATTSPVCWLQQSRDSRQSRPAGSDPPLRPTYSGRQQLTSHIGRAPGLRRPGVSAFARTGTSFPADSQREFQR